MRVTSIGLALAAALTGCSALGETSTTPSHTATRSQLAQAQASHEYPSPPAPPQRATSAAAAPLAAIRAFATRYINWRSDTILAQMHALAAQSVGQARSAVQLAAANTAGDYELQRGGVANSGTVEAIAPLRGRTNQYVVVTLERTTATNTTAYQGLRAAWHLALAATVRLPNGRWAVSEWKPES